MKASDIFISYAWADNDPPVGAVNPKVDRWVWMFDAALKIALKSVGGQQRSVWLDRRNMRADQVVKDRLEQGLFSSRLLLVMMSRSWLASDWCRAEVEAFVLTHQRSGGRERIWVIETAPLKRDKWHDRLRDVAGFPFYKPLDDGRSTMPFGYPLPNPVLDRDYYFEVLKLATQIVEVLDDDDDPELDDDAASPPAPSPDGNAPAGVAPTLTVNADVSAPVTANAAANPSADPAETAAAAAVPVPRERVVWIAEPTDDLLRLRRDLRDAVRHAGYEVLVPDLASLTRACAFGVDAALQAQLAGAGLYVQLLGRHAGRDLDDGRNWGRLQHAQAQAANAAGGWPSVIWRDIGTGTESDDPEHAQLLFGAIEQNFDDLRRAVLARLPVVLAPPPPLPSAAAAGPVSVCVTCSEEDQPISDQVVALLDQLGADYTQVVDSVGDSAQENRFEAAALKSSQGVVIVYGAADPNWLFAKIQHTNQFRKGRDSAWSALIDSPVGKRPAAPRARAVELHDWTGGPRKDLMQRFVDSIRAVPRV